MTKTTPEKWAELEETALAFLEGKASPLKFKTGGKKRKTIYEIYGEPKIQAILSNLANTSLTHREIAMHHQVPISLVWRLSQKRTKELGGAGVFQENIF